MKLQPRDFQILTWLVHMKFMLLDQITRVFFEGSNPNRAPYRRILKLMKYGLIDTRKVHEELCDVYVPTKKVVGLLRSNKTLYILGLSKDQAGFNYGHDRTLVDLRTFFRQLGIGMWIPERIIRAVKPRGWHPDGLIFTKKALNALEYEHTEKKLARYETILSRYASARKCYQRVLYVTASPSLHKRLSDKFGLPPNMFFISKKDLFLKKEAAVFEGPENSLLTVQDLIREAIPADLSEFDPEALRNIMTWALEYLQPGNIYPWWENGYAVNWDNSSHPVSPVEDEQRAWEEGKKSAYFDLSEFVDREVNVTTGEDFETAGTPDEEEPCEHGRTPDCG